MGKFSGAEDLKTPSVSNSLALYHIQTQMFEGETVFTWLQKTSVSVLHGFDEKPQFLVPVQFPSQHY